MRHIFTSFLSSGAVQIANVITGIVAARFLLPEGIADAVSEASQDLERLPDVARKLRMDGAGRA